jgi:NADPH:quinone reductase-like Zn-dependent oxidoreductase
LVRIEAAAVAHLDVTVSSGTFGLRPELPYVGGVEGCGRVVSSDVFEVGTRVMLRGGGLGIKRGGTWAEYVVAPTRSLTQVPDGMPAALAATYFVPTTTAQVALMDVARLGSWPDIGRPEDEIVVVAGAAGAVGSMVTQLAKRAGCQVIGLVADQQQAERLPEGVEGVTSADDERLRELRDDRTATLLVDTLGGPDLL